MENDDDNTQSFVALTKGTMVAHYRIAEKIGAGGMGEVYLAEDTTLKRKVALKFMPAHTASNADMRERFTREARAAAQLDHPNIVPVYEVGEHRGRPFFAMAHIEGQPLRDVIKQGKLSTAEAVRLTMQICEGLYEAHEAGVVHRDVKPGNVIIDTKGRARILDFGLAMVSGEDKLTKTGSTLGTVGYMSPEQVSGKQVDHRSDLFSVGVILYEMLTGRRPFEGDNDAAIVNAITNSSPEPIARFKSGVTGELQQIVDKALQKDPSLRYQHADGMLSDLKRLEVGSGPARKSRLGLWAAVAVVVALAGYFAVDRFMLPDEETAEGWTNSVAVLVFRNLSTDPEQDFFCEGMTDEIIGRLQAIRQLKVTSMQSMLRFKGTDLDLKKIGKELGVANILEGSIQREGDSIRIRAQLIRVEDDAHIWSERYYREVQSVFAIQEEISRTIADVMEVTLGAAEETFASKRGTDNLEAYNAFTRGIYFWRKRTDEGLRTAISYFEEAIALDSSYASAWSYLASSWANIPSYSNITEKEAYPHAERASLKGLELDDNLAETHASRGLILKQTGKYAEAEKEYLRAIELNPGYSWTHLWYARLAGLEFGRQDEFDHHIKIAYELDPLSLPVLNNLQWDAVRKGDMEKVIEYANRAFEIEPKIKPAYNALARGYLNIARDTVMALQVVDQMIEQLPDYWESYDLKGYILSNVGRQTEAREAFEKAVEVAPDNWKAHSQYGWFLDGQRHFDEAIERFSRAIELDSNQFDPVLGLAYVLTRMGRTAEAGPLYKRAVELAPYDARAHRNYGHYLQYSVGDLDEAIKYYNRAVELNPRYASGYRSLARAYEQADAFDQALRAIDKAIEIEPATSQNPRYRAILFTIAGEFDSAIAAFQSYRELRPNDPVALRYLGDIYTVTQRYSQADSIYNIIATLPDSMARGWGWEYRVRPLRHQGRIREVLDQLQEGIELDRKELGHSEPLLDKMRHHLGYGLLFLNDTETAAADLRQARTVHETMPSKSAWWYAWLAAAEARIEARAGRIEEGKQMLHNLIAQTDPGDAAQVRMHQYYLGMVHRLAGDFDSAVIIMEGLVTAEPHFSHRLYLGISYVGAGRYVEAVEVLETAMARYDANRFNSIDESVTGHYYLGTAYEGAGRTEDAINQYEIFLDIWKNADAEIKILDTARTRLAKLRGGS